MDWNAAIEKNREALKRILATLVAMAALAGGATLPRHLHRAVLRLLRPAEAAARRLIIVTARGLVVALPQARPRKPKLKSLTWRDAGRAGVPAPSENLAPRALPLPLLDPLPRWGRRARPAASGVPRISVPGFTRLFRVRPQSPDDPIDATRLASRLEALASALDDLPGQARRFARWRARRDAAGAQARQGRHAGRARRLWPLRPGRPPGGRRRPVHEVHEVLNVVHGLAFWALQSTDTS
ncbi:hypothetical protein [Mesorhizobium sp. WSM2239]|uniref:Heparinase n=2 Tax=unclassified Mesorhizobium TaxID=325217 RepID=A0AAU8DFD3_9HYPH